MRIYKNFVKASIIFCALICAVSSAYAATIIVPRDFSQIQDAINAASSGDMVKIMEGAYTQGDIIMKDGVDIVGQRGKAVAITGGVTAANNAALRHLTIQKDSSGPVISAGVNNFAVEECAVENLSGGATGYGIAITPGADNITVKNTVVYVGNHTDYDIGIYLNNAANVVIESSTVHIKPDPGAAISENTACIYSAGNNTYALKNNILTLEDAALNAINANSDTPVISYNCILGKISPPGLQHKGTITAAPSYSDAANGDFHLAQAQDNIYKSPSVAMDSGDPQSEYYYEMQYLNYAIDIGAYGNTVNALFVNLPADFDLDSDIDNNDFSVMVTHWNQTGVSHAEGDITYDGKVGLADLDAFLKYIIALLYPADTLLYDDQERLTAHVYTATGEVELYVYDGGLFSVEELLNSGMLEEGYILGIYPPTYDGKLIQDAIDIASDGSTVTLTPGIYVLSADLKITKNIRLLGSGPDSTVIHTGQYSIELKDYTPSWGGRFPTNVIIEAITVRGHTGLTKATIEDYAKTLTLKDCKLIDNIGSHASAIYAGRKALEGTNTLILDNCLVANNINRGTPLHDVHYSEGYWKKLKNGESTKGKLVSLQGTYWVPTKDESLAGVIYLDKFASLIMKNSTIANNINDLSQEPFYYYAGIPVYSKYAAIAASSYSYIVGAWTGTRYEPGILNSIMWNNGRDGTPKGDDIAYPVVSYMYTVVTISNSCVQLDLSKLITTYSYAEGVIQEDPLLDSNYIPQNPNCATMGARF